MQGTIFFSFLLFAINKAYFLLNPRNIISNIIMYFNINSTRGHTGSLLVHTIGSADEQLDELNTMTRSSYIDTADLKGSLASTKDQFTVFSLNVQSINSKFKLIYPLMLELNNADMAFSAICLQESWLPDDSDLSQYQLPNYNIIHQGENVQATEVY